MRPIGDSQRRRGGGEAGRRSRGGGSRQAIEIRGVRSQPGQRPRRCQAGGDVGERVQRPPGNRRSDVRTGGDERRTPLSPRGGARRRRRGRRRERCRRAPVPCSGHPAGGHARGGTGPMARRRGCPPPRSRLRACKARPRRRPARRRRSRPEPTAATAADRARRDHGPHGGRPTPPRAAERKRHTSRRAGRRGRPGPAVPSQAATTPIPPPDEDATSKMPSPANSLPWFARVRARLTDLVSTPIAVRGDRVSERLGILVVVEADAEGREPAHRSDSSGRRLFTIRILYRAERPRPGRDHGCLPAEPELLESCP